ncbi:DEAD/DEAH box helicase [Roseomonas genomospecies 6]|uniref:Restriction endonuclease subunit R n=1 Tax=Roseomonas genomospecies 6 TaxID=214106 RepID=A0A9W7NP65_9PROT|nr:DEAD/DEAH box helicase family protein [Roseomonas genomospecies 6]KAA0684146.1 restriction endonuclease subunit R [Roseomonas genomospecies 6]
MVAGIAGAIAQRQTDVRDVLAAVTPGGGKSLLPVIMGAALMRAGLIDRICWIVPRDSLRRQAEEAFADPRWREVLGHGIALRAAENGRDPCRGLQGYVTTYQAVAAAPDLHLQEFRRHRYLLAVDELHHLPAVSDTGTVTAASDETAWSRSILPLMECAAVRLLMSGTLERADGRPILWLPYRAPQGTRRVREIDFKAPGWAIVGYSRRQALAEKAILPVTFGAMDGSATWLDAERTTRSVEALSRAGENTRDALFTALRTGFAQAMLREAYRSCREHRAKRRAAGNGPDGAGHDGAGLGKLLVIAPDQETARNYLDTLRGWMPGAQAARMAQIAISERRDAQEVVAAFRLRPEPAVLVSVAMAYEGLDAPAISHVACLTHIRSRPWLEQAIARATRVDPHAGAYEQQRALIYHPSDALFERFRQMVETQQGTRAMVKARRQHELPFDRTVEAEPEIIPLESNATALRFAVVAPGPDFGSPPSARETPSRETAGQPAERAPRTPSVVEHHLRQRIGQIVAAQVIEDQDNNLVAEGPVSYHTYNAVLKRCMNKARSEMTLSELESAIGWLERNRISDHLHLIADDPQYRWSSRRKARGAGSVTAFSKPERRGQPPGTVKPAS